MYASMHLGGGEGVVYASMHFGRVCVSQHAQGMRTGRWVGAHLPLPKMALTRSVGILLEFSLM